MTDKPFQRVKLVLPPDIHERLQQLEKSLGPSRAEIVREHMSAYLRTLDDRGAPYRLVLDLPDGTSPRADVAHQADVSALTILELERAAASPLRSQQGKRIGEPTFLSVFISYGGPDETFARTIYRGLAARGVRVFFFPETAKPGQRIHRTMNEGVHDYDRIVRICSEESLNRPGVLNEIEQVLAREAAEGGTELLLPITIDDYVFKRWSPARADIARQIRQRVAIRLSSQRPDSASYAKQFVRLVEAITVET